MYKNVNILDIITRKYNNVNKEYNKKTKAASIIQKFWRYPTNMNYTSARARPLLKSMNVPEKYLPRRRIGEKSADGVAFILNDQTKVGKLILCKTESDYHRAEREFLIGRAMGRKGIGPNVYTYYETKNSTNRINIFSNRQQFGFIYIIMDNLWYGAKRLYTMREYIRKGYEYPKNKVLNLLDRMEASGVVHGNLHRGNIIVVTDKKGGLKVYFIDFGRSLLFNKQNFTRNNIGTQVNAYNPVYRRRSGPHLRILNRNILYRNINT